MLQEVIVILHVKYINKIDLHKDKGEVQDNRQNIAQKEKQAGILFSLLK